MPGDVIRVLEREAIARHGAQAHDGVAKRIDGKAQQAEQIANLFALKETPEVQYGNTAGLQRGSDLIEASVGTAKDGLISEPHARAFELPDVRREARGFIVERFEIGEFQDGSARRLDPNRAPRSACLGRRPSAVRRRRNCGQSVPSSDS